MSSDDETDRARQLVRQGRADEAERLIDHLLEVGGATHRPEAVFVKAIAVAAQGRGDEAVTLVDDTLAKSLPDDAITAKALELKARLIGRTDPSKAVELRRTLIDQFESADDPQLRDLVTLSLFEVARTMDGDARPADALELLDRLSNRLDDLGETALRRRPQLVVEAAYLRAVALTEVGRQLEASNALRAFIEQSDIPDATPAVRRMVAQATCLLAGLLSASGDRGGAAAMLASVVERFALSDDAGLQPAVVRALKLRAAMTDDRRDDPAALAAWTELIEYLPNSSSTLEPGLLAEASYRRGVVSLRLGRLEDAAFDFAAASGADEPGSWRTEALVASAGTLLRLGRESEAYAVVERLAAALSDEQEGAAAAAAVTSAWQAVRGERAILSGQEDDARLLSLVAGLGDQAGPARRAAAATAQLQALVGACTARTRERRHSRV